MKNLKSLLLAGCACLLLSSCYSVRILAPPDGNVSLANKNDNLAFKQDQRQWFVLWGLVPINDNNTEEIIRKNKLTKVRVETKIKFLDVVISMFTSIASIVTTTTVVEGETGQ